VSDFDPNVPPPVPNQDLPTMAQRPGNGLAIASLVLGIVSIALLCVWYISLPCALLAIIFGAIGRGKAKEGATGGGMATAGLICGVIAFALVFVVVGLVCAGISILGTEGIEQLQQAAEEAARQAEQSGAGTTP